MRLKYIDFLRFLALFYMFFQHAVYALLDINSNTGIIKFLFDIVPVCSALFLFISGFSITIIFKKYGISMINRLLLKGIMLIFFSSLLFFLENGFQFPDIFFGSGILNTIGILLLIASILIILPHKILFTSLIILILIIISYFLEINHIMIYPLNNAYEPVVPTVIFGFIGLLCGFIINTKINKKKSDLFILSAALAGIILFVVFFILNSYFKVFTSEGRIEITRIFNKEFIFLENLVFNRNANGIIYKYIWNFKMNNFFATLGIVLFLFAVFSRLEFIFQNRIMDFIIIPGQYALLNYFYHLLLITFFVFIFGFNELKTIYFLIILTSIYIISYPISLFIKYLNKRNKKAHQGISPV